MKKCDYCGKEISYFDQYCCDECQKETIKFYDNRDKYTNLFSIINGICVFGIPIGLIVFSLVNYVGAGIISLSTLILGLTIIFLPFPVENMITKFKLKKAIKLTRIFGIIIFTLGIIATISFAVIYLI